MPKKKQDDDAGNVAINKELLPGYSVNKHVEVQITYNFILDLYERSKKLEGKDKEDMLQTIHELTKHIGKWLVS